MTDSTNPIISILGPDPPRTHRTNANSFQQHAVYTFKDWQYAAFWRSKDSRNEDPACHLVLGRRYLTGVTPAVSKPSGASWQYITFTDYEQTCDDGHNTISLGICEGDGTIHLSFDHHCDPLRFRMSLPEVATDPAAHKWTPFLFSPVQSSLPGILHSDLFDEVTYPQFVTVDESLLLCHRIGQAGSGSQTLHIYEPSTGVYRQLGTFLRGVGNSPYINGLDYRDGVLHVSWCYRQFVEYEGVRDTSSTAHKAQAGPNGPENNYGLFYARSLDRGRNWENSSGQKIVALSGPEDGIYPDSKRILVYNIPTNSGILNQEGQCVDSTGGFWVLNREMLDDVESWIIYHRKPAGSWSRHPIPNPKPTTTGNRGSICADRDNNIYAVLPGNEDSSLTILCLRLNGAGRNRSFHEFWVGDSFDGEPTVDIGRMAATNTLSVFTRTSRKGGRPGDVVVVEF